MNQTKQPKTRSSGRDRSPFEEAAAAEQRRDLRRLRECQPCGGGWRVIRKQIRSNG